MESALTHIRQRSVAATLRRGYFWWYPTRVSEDLLRSLTALGAPYSKETTQSFIDQPSVSLLGSPRISAFTWMFVIWYCVGSVLHERPCVLLILLIAAITCA